MITQLCEFVVPGKCVGYNGHFKINYSLKQIYLTTEAREWKRTVAIHTPKIEFGDTEMIHLSIYVYQNWYYKNGKLKKEDIHNMDKILIDAMFNKWGIDDSRVSQMCIHKVQSLGEQYVMVRVAKTDNIIAD